MLKKILSIATFAFIVTVTVSFAGMTASPGGLAYDSFTKFQMGGSDAAALDPVPFDPAFEAASKTQMPSGKGGLFSLGKTLSQVGGLMKNGTAARYYYLGQKSRTDDVSANTYKIVDCVAGTRTYVDNNKKTYRIESLYATPAPSTGTPSGKPGPRGTVPPDDGTRYNVKLTTAALGPRKIEGVDTQGYSSTVDMTATKATGETSNMTMLTRMFISGYAKPQSSCRNMAMPQGGRAAQDQAAAYQAILESVRNKDKRFTASATGPALPTGKLAVFDVIQPTSDKQGHGAFTVVVQNGHIRSLTDADATLFAVPAGYTQTDDSAH